MALPKDKAVLPVGSNIAVSPCHQAIAAVYGNPRSRQIGLRVMEERFEKHREFLVDRIDPDFGLLDKLLPRKILTRESVHKIKLKDNTTEDKNRILLDLILKNKKANELVSALRDSGQTHLVNYLNANGEHESTFGDDWPLSDSEINRLDINRESLVDLLDTSDLCIRLFSEKVINNRQKQLIFSKPTDAEKNEALLDILTKCSLRQYKITIGCLNNSNQRHIAKLLSEGGVLVRVHANIEGAVGNVDELEEGIITQLKRVLENRPLEEATRLLELTKLDIIATRKGQSIIIYIHCTTNDELLHLIDLLKTYKLKEIIERVFTDFVSIGDALMVTLTWSLEEFRRASTYFDRPLLSVEESTDLLKGQSATPNLGKTMERKSPDIKGYVETPNKSKQILPVRMPLRTKPSPLEDKELESTGLAKNKMDPVLVGTISTKAAEEGKKGIRGLTLLDKELFIVSQSSSEIEVYDAIELSFRRRWNLSKLIDPWDIASCVRNKCIYVIDSEVPDCKGHQSKEMFRVDQNGKLIKKWSTGDDLGWSLSVTDQSNVILTVSEKNKLNEYSPDGQLIREINLSPDAGICHPFHAIKLTNGHFVVSHGIRRDDLHRVCIVDADGDLVKSFGGKCGSTVGQMNGPTCLSVDGNGFVMVLDRWNRRILLLDSELEFKREILSKEKQSLRVPWRIILDESTDRLFVADNKCNGERF